MCNIFPRHLPSAKRQEINSKAELQFYDECQKQLDDQWTVVYDVRWSDPEVCIAGNGQIDFIVAHEELGALVVEVKGGGIERDTNTRQWLQVDRFRKHPIDPIAQVQKSMYALRHALRKRAILPASHLGLFHAVAFPQATTTGTEWTIEMPSQLTISREHMSSLDARLREIFAYHRPQLKKRPYTLGRRLIEEILAITNNNVRYVHSLSAQIEEDERELLKLTNEQTALLNCLDRNKRVLVDGCAGSGKTLLALAKARQLAETGKRVLLTCFNVALERSLRESTEGIDNLDVVRFHQLCRRHDDYFNPILPEIGQFISDDDPNFPAVLVAAAESNPDLKYDAVIIDEAQDFRPEWGLALESCLRGEESLLYVFKDSGQRLYWDREPYEPTQMCVFKLKKNIRNSQAIGKYVSRHISNDAEMILSGPEGRDVDVRIYNSTQDMLSKVSQFITNLIAEEQISPQDIVVLTPRSIERSALNQLTLQNAPISKRKRTKGTVLISSVYQFKGLDSDFVVVVELDEQFARKPAERQSSHCYTAFSRAKHHLVVLASAHCASTVLGARPSLSAG